MSRYTVVQYRAQNNPRHGFRELAFVGVVSGMGKNRGTWDADHSRSSAFRHAAVLRKEVPGAVFRVEAQQ